MSDILRFLLKFESIEKLLELIFKRCILFYDKCKKLLGSLKILWHNELSTLYDGSWFLVVNEFLDTLPVIQIIKNGGRWTERLIY